jgi:hypothetical protein
MPMKRDASSYQNTKYKKPSAISRAPFAARKAEDGEVFDAGSGVGEGKAMPKKFAALEGAEIDKRPMKIEAEPIK